ncbi:hypothetical protein [Legionella sp. W05-934-2]|uniref:FAD-binding protein n=1 Tax=Legionella sp. W05-934-2 TaxID=1198649 RepID=UPI003461C02F
MELSKLDAKKAIVANLKKHGIQAEIVNWENFMGTVESPSSVVIEIKSAKQAKRATQVINEVQANCEQLLTRSGVAGWKDTTTCPVVRFFKDIFCQPTERYNESFTANASSAGDIIFRFPPDYQKNKLKIVADGEEVEIPAGIQISKLQQFLGKHKRSLGTATMINKVSGVGAILNGCQGTGKDQPTLAGLVTQLTILKPDGTIVKLNKSNEDFDTLKGANLGLTGIVLSARLKTVPQFKLREKVDHFTRLADLREHLSEWLQSEYFTAMITPLYGVRQIDDALVPNIQVRRWQRTSDKITEHRDVHDYTVEDLASEIGVQIGDEVQTLLLRTDLHLILEAYLALTAVIVAAQRGEKDKVATANNMMHYQRSFPKSLNLVSFQLSVPDDKAGEILDSILSEGERLQQKMNNSEDHLLPVTYATYVRYIKGTSGGLSTCPEKPGHHVLIVEYVTHPLAPGFNQFIDGMRAFYQKNNWDPKFHLGKSLPEEISQFIDSKQLEEFKQALTNWYGSEEAAFEKNPMFNSFLKTQFGMPLSEADNQLMARETVAPVIDDENAIKAMHKLVDKLKKRQPSCDSEASAINQFCALCTDKISQMESQLRESQAVSI